MYSYWGLGKTHQNKDVPSLLWDIRKEPALHHLRGSCRECSYKLHPVPFPSWTVFLSYIPLLPVSWWHCINNTTQIIMFYCVLMTFSGSTHHFRHHWDKVDHNQNGQIHTIPSPPHRLMRLIYVGKLNETGDGLWLWWAQGGWTYTFLACSAGFQGLKSIRNSFFLFKTDNRELQHPSRVMPSSSLRVAAQVCRKTALQNDQAS